jgi:NhaP-type Na+/H+ and K+/H+ antiporter
MAVAPGVLSYTQERNVCLGSKADVSRTAASMPFARPSSTLTFVLLLVSGLLPLFWTEFDWQHAATALALILVVRPLAGWFSLGGTGLLGRERLVVAAYGVRALTILISTILHGLTAGAAVEQVTEE